MIVNEHYVAFIDILGFSEKVSADFARAEIDERSNLNAIKRAILKSRELNDGNKKIGVQQFSDSIIVDAKFSRDEFPSFLAACGSLQADLLKMDVLVRGGIAYGKHYSDDGVLYSQALIEAYKLESQEAITPRILISNDLVTLIYKDQSEAVASGRIEVDGDRHWFVKFSDFLSDQERETCVKTAEIERSSRRGRVAAKYNWLCNYLKS